MDVWLFLLLSVVVGICLSIYAYALDSSKFNHIESTLGIFDFMRLHLLRTAHFIVFVFFALYVFFVDLSVKSDTIVILLTILMFLHWSVFDGCILTILEKHILFPNGMNCPDKIQFLSLLNVPEELTNIPYELILIVVFFLACRLWVAK